MRHLKASAGIIVIAILLAPLVSFAQNGQQETREEAGARPESVGTQESKEIGQGLGTRNEASTQNQGEEQQNRIQIQEEAGNMVQTGSASATAPEAKQSKNKVSQGNDMAAQRRSKVANAVQEMLAVAERNGGIGQQIRTIAQEQNRQQEKIEEEIQKVETRGKVKKFFFGPDYRILNSISGILDAQAGKLKNLKELAGELPDEADTEVVKKQVQSMEQVKAEVEKKIKEEKDVFSMFGWLVKIFA